MAHAIEVVLVNTFWMSFVGHTLFGSFVHRKPTSEQSDPFFKDELKESPVASLLQVLSHLSTIESTSELSLQLHIAN